MKKLAIVVTHPIQYYVPVFQLLSQKCILKVFYTWGQQGISERYDPDFKKIINWDLPLLEGYDYELLENISRQPGSHHNKGIINPNIIDRIQIFNPTAILIYGYRYHSHFNVMRYFRKKTPLWFRGDSTLLDEKFGIKAILKTIYLRWVYKHIDKAFYVGTNNKAYFLKYGLKEEQLTFAPHAIDNKRFSEDRHQEVSNLRGHLKIGPKDFVILFAGKLEDKKNPLFLLHTFYEISYHMQKMNQSPEKIHLVFVGNGPLEEELKLKTKTWGLSNVHFLDFQNQTQMPVIYQLCDFFCLPSKGPGETWGLAVNEAMAASKGIITSDKVGCATDLIKEGQNGFVFNESNSHSLYEILSLLINNQEAIKQYGLKSKEIIQSWNFERQAAVFIEQLYEC